MNLPNEVLSLKNRKPSQKPKPKVTQLDWRGRAAELITLKLGKTAQVYLDRAMDSLTTVWEPNFPLDGETEEQRERQARRQAERHKNLTTIATMCDQASKMKGSPQERANKIISALITRKMTDTILLFIESVVRRAGVSAYFEYRRYLSHTAINPEVALANLEQMRQCHALNGEVLEGEDGEALFANAFNAAHDHGESVSPGEDHSRDDASNAPIPIAATDTEDAELSALAIQQWASAYWRLMTNNKEEDDVLPFAVERVEPGVYRNYTEFTTFCDYRTESYNARLQRQKLEGLEALEAVRNKIADDGFVLPGS